ncbi:XrtA-associated tyrosine autokinase [Govanella unica]|uniref:non-specific protein-tyrosine kinase n=1 Tax=Govanella unica TaxID=2975056 RepID=A0A9X3TXK1_9PROT|nr:XrtA-associated tyrosine autokinase [Govania unica]MDA5193601.1 XrtA-associated tyrosine autokinase [Govania unica]
MDLIERAAEKMKKAGGSLVERAAEKMAQSTEKKSTVGSPVIHPSPVAAEAVAAVEAPMSAPLTGSEPERRPGKRVNIDIASLKARNFITPDSETTTMAEEFRIVKRSLLLNAFAKGDGAIRNGNLILVTSTQPGEGKTFCSVNLAMSIASERDTTVLLVDADTHKPEVLRTLGVEGGKGLVDVISDNNLDLSDCLMRTNVENLVLLPAGRQHNSTTELLASERMGDIVEEIAKRYPDRIVIFDSPPALASSISSVLALHVGQILFVVEAERTREPQLKEALSLVSSCQHINLLLNKSRYSAGDKKFGSYYGYGA